MTANEFLITCSVGSFAITAVRLFAQNAKAEGIVFLLIAFYIGAYGCTYFSC